MKELKFQLSTALLTIVTVAAVVAAAINFEQRIQFHGLAEDGAIWVDRQDAVEALHVRPRSGAAVAGIHSGDWLLSINGEPVHEALDVTRILVRVGTWTKANYHLRRGKEFDAIVITEEVARDRAVMYQYLVGCVYLIIGLFVYFRRGSAQQASHFYVLCLTSFIFLAFHYTGQLNNLDKVIYLGNFVAGAVAPIVFLHFCLTFPEPNGWFRSRYRLALLYLPSALLTLIYIGFSSQTLKASVSPIELNWMLNRVWVLFTVVPYLLGGVAVSVAYRKAEDPIVRKQLKWLRNGTFCAMLPYTLFYVLPYALGAVPSGNLRLAVLSVVLLPLSLAYAIVRYRLMDVDILFRRGYAYTLATICVLAGFYLIVFTLGSLAHVYFNNLGNAAPLIVMLLGAFLFQPIRTWIQEKLDRYFYRDRYDYRSTLVEFAQELSSEADLDTMLAKAGERLIATLSVSHLAFFLREEGVISPSGEPIFRMRAAMGDNPRLAAAAEGDPDLSFLNWKLSEPYLFFERTHHQIDAISTSWAPSVRRSIADLDLTYYVPCTVRGRTIAYLGISRTMDGDYLASVDMELLATLAGYVGIAIENASLYRSLQRKVEEYERLKEFSENIVESINVGILAADLDDRVESWNSQIELLSGIPRERAVGRRLAELFPAALVAEFDRVRGETGIHHIYKFVLKAPAGTNGNGHAGASPRPEATLNIAIAPLVSKDQERIGRLVIFDDVTDRAELEQRLVQADKLSSIGLLAAGVAHEVNTPLAVISTYAQMLAKQVADDTQKSLILDKIAKQTFRASEIVNSLLNFSRTSSTSFGEVKLNRVIQETISLLEHQLQKTGIQVHAELDPEVGSIHGNAGKLQQVFLNLILNARDAMRGGGALEVRTWQDGARAHVEVADSGTGIAPEHLHRVYDPFFTTKPARQGTGLGLAVTYGIIQEHSGSIEVSNRPGGGAQFHIELPLTKAAAAAAAAAPVPVEQPVSAA
jgi:PAS domain S-box-containing protein